MPSRDYIGKYSVHRSGRFQYRLWKCTEAKANASTGTATNHYFDSFEEATIACYRLNGWGWPRFIDPVTRKRLQPAANV